MNNSQVNNIEWKDGAVCYADGEQRYAASYISNKLMCGDLDIDYYGDFQLNEPRQGDYIPKSELDTEQKYNNAVEVFVLFGFNFMGSAIKEFRYFTDSDSLGCCDDGLWQLGGGETHKERELTYNQLMTIGKLKRLMNERNNTVLSLDEETELKSRSMESELNSQSNDDEWPKVGDEVCWSNGHRKGELKCIHDGWAWVKVDDNDFASIMAEKLKKPKTPEDILSEELAKKGVQDVYILACQIINGEFDSIKYVPKGGK